MARNLQAEAGVARGFDGQTPELLDAFRGEAFIRLGYLPDIDADGVEQRPRVDTAGFQPLTDQRGDAGNGRYLFAIRVFAHRIPGCRRIIFLLRQY